MSYSDPLTASPFLISKSIMKHPLRTQVPKGYNQVKQTNIHLFINKKHSELASRFGGEGQSSKDKALTYLTNRMENNAAIEKDLEKGVKINFQRDLDRLSKKILEEQEDQKPKDYIYIESQLSQENTGKKEPPMTKDQRLRELVHGNIAYDKLQELFEQYKKKQFAYEAKRQKEEKAANIAALLKIKSNKIEAIDDFFVVQTMNQNNINLKEVTKCPEIEAKDLEEKEPAHEVERELDEIIETDGSESQDDVIPMKEKLHWVEIFKLGELASLTKNEKLHYHRLSKYLDTIANPYDYFSEMQDLRKQKKDEDPTLQKRFCRDKKGIVYQQTTRSMSVAASTAQQWRLQKKEQRNVEEQINRFASTKDLKQIRSSSMFDGTSTFITNPYRSVSPEQQILEFDGKYLSDEKKPQDNAYNLNKHYRSCSVPKLYKVSPSPSDSPKKGVNPFNSFRSSKGFESLLASTRPSTSMKSIGISSRRPSARLRISKFSTPNASPRANYDDDDYQQFSSKRKAIDARASMQVSKRLELEKREVKERFDKFYEDHGEELHQTQQETKQLSKSITAEKIDLRRKYNSIDRVNASTLKVLKNPEHTTNFQNLIHFKKKLVTKLVESITNKEEVLVAVQKKKTFSAMVQASETLKKEMK